MRHRVAAFFAQFKFRKIFIGKGLQNFRGDYSCSYAKACVGGRAGGSDPFLAAVDCIVEAPACVQMEWVLETLEGSFGVQVLPIGLPRKFEAAEGLDYYREELAGSFSGKIIEGMVGWVPFKRLEEPDEIAAATCFIASDDASYMTGQTISVSGGLSMF